MKIKIPKIRPITFLIAIYCMLIPLENVLAASAGASINKYIGLLIMLMIGVSMIRKEVFL